MTVTSSMNKKASEMCVMKVIQCMETDGAVTAKVYSFPCGRDGDL